MGTLFDTQRYLSNFDTSRLGHVFADVLVIGSGIAGARAALAAAAYGDVVLMTKRELLDSSTAWAQGGVAAVTDKQDSYAAHCADTLRVGCGLNDPAVVDLTVRTGPEEIRQLLEWGVPFDHTGDALALTREAGHHQPRVLHARGDSTGRAIVETLERRLRACPHLRLFENCFAIDLVSHQDRCLGAVAYHPQYGHQVIWAHATVMAGGGCGRMYRETTNPPVATGDPLALAYRAGVVLGDLEMIQFHPTALYVAGASRALVSEAVRGEGAHLVDRTGQRFMPAFHPDAELAPRDVVSRAIVTTLRETDSTSVFLDVRHLPPEQFAQRFPYITHCCREFGIDVEQELIPVRPAAHYSIGGILTDQHARTSLERLYACGECAATGLHGANRLASNSLLEGMVFGRIAGEQAGRTAAEEHQRQVPVPLRAETPASPKTRLDLADVRNSLRSLMWRNVGIERHGDRLLETVEIIEFWGRFLLDKVFDTPEGWEVQNMLTAAWLVTCGALQRRESLGVHFRSDAPTDTAPPRLYHLHVRRCSDGLSIAEVPVPDRDTTTSGPLP